MQGRSEIRRLRSVCETTLKNYLCIQLSVSLSLACSLALSLSLCLYLYVSLLYRERQIRPTHLHARENVREVNTRISLNFTCVYVYIYVYTHISIIHTRTHKYYLVPGLSRITWVFYTSARRLLRERIIDDTSSYQALHLHFHILRRPPRAPASVSLSRLARARPSSHDCVLVYCRPCIHLVVNRALLKSP